MSVSSANQAGRFGLTAVERSRIRPGLEVEWDQWALTSIWLLISREINTPPTLSPLFFFFFPFLVSAQVSFLVNAHASVNIYTTVFVFSRALRALQPWSQWRYAKSQSSLHPAPLCWTVLRALFLKSYFREFPSIDSSLFQHSLNSDKSWTSSPAATFLYLWRLATNLSLCVRRHVCYIFFSFPLKKAQGRT